MYTGNFSQQYYDFDIINNLKPIILPKHHLNITSNLYKSIITKKLEQINIYSTHSFIHLSVYLSVTLIHLVVVCVSLVFFFFFSIVNCLCISYVMCLLCCLL